MPSTHFSAPFCTLSICAQDVTIEEERVHVSAFNPITNERGLGYRRRLSVHNLVASVRTPRHPFHFPAKFIYNLRSSLNAIVYSSTSRYFVYATQKPFSTFFIFFNFKLKILSIS